MDYSFSLMTKFRLKPQYLIWTRVTGLVLCYVLNLYIMSTSEIKVEYTQDVDDTSHGHLEVIQALAVLGILVMIINLIIYYIIKVKITSVNLWSQYFSDIKNLKNITVKDREWLEVKLRKNIFEFTKNDYNELI